MINKFAKVMSCLVLALLMATTVTVCAARTPNYATNYHKDMSLYYYGYVQCQPSYVEHASRAARGYLRYWRYDLRGNIIYDTQKLYTAESTGPNDSRILHRKEMFTDSILSNPNKTQFRYGFTWVPVGSDIWPFQVSPITE